MAKRCHRGIWITAAEVNSLLHDIPGRSTKPHCKNNSVLRKLRSQDSYFLEVFSQALKSSLTTPLWSVLWHFTFISECQKYGRPSHTPSIWISPFMLNGQVLTIERCPVWFLDRTSGRPAWLWTHFVGRWTLLLLQLPESWDIRSTSIPAQWAFLIFCSILLCSSGWSGTQWSSFINVSSAEIIGESDHAWLSKLSFLENSSKSS